MGEVEDEEEDNEEEKEKASEISVQYEEANQSNIYQGDGAASIGTATDSDMEDDSTDATNETNEYINHTSDNVSVIESLAGVSDEEDNNNDTNDDELNQEEQTETQQSIPVYISYARERIVTEPRAAVLRTVNIYNSRTEASLLLPVIAVTNFRSLGPKVENVRRDILERNLDLVLCSETWQKDSNQKLKSNIEKMLEEDGLLFMSCPRPSKRRGGGCAVIVNQTKFTAEQLPIMVPYKLEVVWSLVRPKVVTKSTVFKEIIACSFYSAPNYRKNGKLLQHLISQMHQLLVKYPKAGFALGGDKNKMEMQGILDALPKCKQIVTKYTYKKRKTLDVIVTNMFQFYALPFVVPAVQVDVPGQGVPSDHDVAVAVPLAGAGEGAVSREYLTKTTRPMPDSGIRSFGQWISHADWSELENVACTTEQGLLIRKIFQEQVDEKFPLKQVRISNIDKPWITHDIKKLDRWKKTEYKKKGKSDKYMNLLNSYNDKVYSASKQYLKKNVSDLMEAAPGRAWAVMKKMGAEPGQFGEEGAFSMTEHMEQNLTVDESLERIVTYFKSSSSYCQ